MRTLPFTFAIFLLFTVTGIAQVDESALKETAEKFFLNLAQDDGKDVTQQFEMTDAMRSVMQKEQSIATVQMVLRPYGGIGEIQKKEIVQHDAELLSVELFYSGTKKPFKARVTFRGTEIDGIHIFPLKAEKRTENIFENMSVTESLIWGIVLIPMVIMSIFLMNGKGAFLIAGYNTMSKKEQAKYDEKALCRSVGRFVLWITCCLMLLPFAIHHENIGAIFGVFGITMASSLVYIIYANTGNRFLKKEDVEIENEEHEENFLDKSLYSGIAQKYIQWIGTICLVAFLALAFTLPILLSGGEQEPTVEITDSGISISAQHGTKIDFTEITDIFLVEHRMHVVVGGITWRTYGYATAATQKGYFRSNNYGSILVFTRTNSSPTIHIQRKDKPDVFLNFSDNDTTRAVYHDMKTALGK